MTDFMIWNYSFWGWNSQFICHHLSIHPHPHMVAVQVAFLTPGKELLKGTFCHHAKKCGKKTHWTPDWQIGHREPGANSLSGSLQQLGREKERTHKKQFHEWKVLVVHTCYKKLPFPCSAAPQKRTVCDALRMRLPEKKLCLLKKRRKPKLFIRASDRRLPKKVCPVVGCFFVIFLPLLIFIFFILCGTWINHKIWFRCQFLDQEVCMTW